MWWKKGEERVGEGGKKGWREKRKKAERKKEGLREAEKKKGRREEKGRKEIKEGGRLLTKYIFIQQLRTW